MASLTIHLPGPICSCAEQSLSWFISGTPLLLVVECKTCAVQLRVPYNGLKAGFKLATPYPKVPDTSPLPDNVVPLKP